MDPEIWVAVAAVFVSGGAIGTAGTLLTQWLVRGLRTHHDPRSVPEAHEVARLRGELRALIRKVRNMDERLDFQEQLLGGASPTRRPPARLPEGDEGTGGSAPEPTDGDPGPTRAAEMQETPGTAETPEALPQG